MRDRPNGAALLDVARRSLLDEVAPALKGQPRYITLMVANAMGIAARELEEAERFERAQSAVLARVERSDDASADALVKGLVQSLRAGRHDADTALYVALKENVDIAADIWKPAPIAKAG
jgi:Domain of unknown function (DUF6285)